MVRDDKYYTDVSRSPESICCPNFVRLVLLRCDYASPSVRPSMFLFVRKRRKHSAGTIRETNFIFNTLSGIFQRLSGHFPAREGRADGLTEKPRHEIAI